MSSLRLLYSLLSARQLVLYLLPAALCSIIAGGIAPFMTYVIGQAFDAFAQFPITPNPPQSAKDSLLHGVGLAALELVGLAAASMALSSLTSCLWIWTGERNVMAVRKTVYDAVMAKDLTWFDTRLHTEDDNGAAGLMAKFTKETDDVRAASSLASGLLLQHFTTTLTALLLALIRAPTLTLVILSAVPLLTVIQIFSQATATPLLQSEISLSATLASTISRSTTLISTVKSACAAPHELAAFDSVLGRITTAGTKLNAVWGTTSALAQSVMMGMFVQGFWFGSKLVREGKATPGDVMAVFWACLIATSNLQMCFPQAIVLGKGKVAIAELMKLVEESPVHAPSASPPPSPTTPASVRPTSSHSQTRPRTLRRITPRRCIGELQLADVTFSYASRAEEPSLHNVTLFLPAGETTFIVGGSGSGKSTVARLLMGMYKVGVTGTTKPQLKSGEGEKDLEKGNLEKYHPVPTLPIRCGQVLLDDQDFAFLDDRWVRRHVMGVTQGDCIIFDGMSVHDNVAVALCAVSDSYSPPDPSAVPREAVVEACRRALLHDFIQGLPEGYDTLLSSGGSSGSSKDSSPASASAMASKLTSTPTETLKESNRSSRIALSGGQRQRLAIARACLRNPSVLILDEPTSALDPPSRSLIHDALKVQRKGKTTIVITHDLSVIGDRDFVYVMRDGEVIERGFRGDLEAGGGGDGEEGGIFKEMMRTQIGGQPEEESPADEQPSPWPVSTYLLPFGPVTRSPTPRPGSRILQPQQPRLSRPLTLGNWMFEVIADLTRSANGPGAVGALGRLSTAANTSYGYDYGYNNPISMGLGVPVPALLANGGERGNVDDENDDEDDDEKMNLKGDLDNGRPYSTLPLPRYVTRQPRPLSVIVSSPPHSPTSPVSTDSESCSQPATPERVYVTPRRRLSLQFTPTSPAFSVASQWGSQSRIGLVRDEEGFEAEKDVLRKCGAKAGERRAVGVKRERRRWDGEDILKRRSMGEEKKSRKWRLRRRVNILEAGKKLGGGEDDSRQQGFWSLIREVYPTIPYKPLVVLGLFACLCSGAMTPIFSFLLSRLLFEVSTGAHNVRVINQFGGIVLGIAALDGFFLGLKYFLMETSSLLWIKRIRHLAFGLVLKQDRKWFDKPGNIPSRLVQILVKDGDDARNLIAVVAGQCLVVCTMLSVGLIWALIQGWQLTLVGFAIAPVFGLCMAVQTRLVARCEVRNKRAREDVSQGYFDAVWNVRAVRAGSYEGVFAKRFMLAAECALRTGVKGAFVEGCTYGVASALIYLAEALLFWVGAVLIAQGTYTYLQMVQVLNLVVFSVTIGSQLMAFTEKIAKSVQAMQDFSALLKLDTDTEESKGNLVPSLDGPIVFQNVSFAYPQRPDVPVLNSFNLEINQGECVAVVGPSGSGKSTVTALLQRLYQPSSGSIYIGLNELREVDVDHLRKSVAAVSQGAGTTLFDGTVKENIVYGTEDASEVDIRRAAKAAGVHEFVMGLPLGYDSRVGESGTGLSGGQAQRVQIARAWLRVMCGQQRGRIVVLDECTSALDGASQDLVFGSLLGRGGERGVREGRTVVVVTHKVDVMRMCDRVVVVEGGRVVEEGGYEELVARRGAFARLASGGEWTGE